MQHYETPCYFPASPSHLAAPLALDGALCRAGRPATRRNHTPSLRPSTCPARHCAWATVAVSPTAHTRLLCAAQPDGGCLLPAASAAAHYGLGHPSLNMGAPLARYTRTSQPWASSQRALALHNHRVDDPVRAHRTKCLAHLHRTHTGDIATRLVYRTRHTLPLVNCCVPSGISGDL
jgi:hypothetical protein